MIWNTVGAQQVNSPSQSLLKGASYLQALLRSLFFDPLSPQHPSCWDSELWRLITNLLKELLMLVTQLCPALCHPMDCSPPGSCVHGILQARMLEWVAISFSRGSSWPRGWTQVSRIAGRLYWLSQQGAILLKETSLIPNPQLLTGVPSHCFKAPRAFSAPHAALGLSLGNHSSSLFRSYPSFHLSPPLHSA